MARKPYTWSRKPTAARRTARALADSARDRAEIARRRALMRLKGHKHMCRHCGKTFRTHEGRDVHTLRHERERGQARTKARNTPRAKTAGRGKHSCGGCGKTFRNHLQLADHARQHAEREDRAQKREQERARRTEAVKGRAARGGKPKGTPKNRGDRARPGQTRAERSAEWHAHRMQHAAGRVDREGNRVPHDPSPRVVQPRTRTEPQVR